MRVSDANIAAIRQGIAARIKTLGFQPKSEKFYRLEEDDPESCSAASLAKWQEAIEPWLEAMHDPKAFASWYEHSQQSASCSAQSASLGLGWRYGECGSHDAEQK